MLRSRQAQLSVIPSQLKSMYRWVLSPQLTHVTTQDGVRVSASEKTAWMPYTLVANHYLREGTKVGFVAGDGVMFVRGECPDFVHNVSTMWRWRPTFTLRDDEHIFFIYAGGDDRTNVGSIPTNRINPRFTFGFYDLAFPMVGRTVGLAGLAPFLWKTVPIQHHTERQLLAEEIEAAEKRLKEKRQLIARLKQCTPNQK